MKAVHIIDVESVRVEASRFALGKLDCKWKYIWLAGSSCSRENKFRYTWNLPGDEQVSSGVLPKIVWIRVCRGQALMLHDRRHAPNHPDNIDG